MEGLATALCQYHQGLPLTNFCRSVTCQRVLCAQCVSDHFQWHKQSNVDIDLEPLVSTFQASQESVRLLYTCFGENYTRLRDLHLELSSRTPLTVQISSVQAKLQRVIDEFFEAALNEANELEHKYQAYMEEQLTIIGEFIQQKHTDLDLVLQKLDSVDQPDRQIKQLLNLTSTSFVKDSRSDSVKCNYFIDFLRTQALDIELKDAELYQIRESLPRIASITNAEFFRNSEKLITPEKRELHPLARPINPNTPYTSRQNDTTLKSGRSYESSATGGSSKYSNTNKFTNVAAESQPNNNHNQPLTTSLQPDRFLPRNSEASTGAWQFFTTPEHSQQNNNINKFNNYNERNSYQLFQLGGDPQGPIQRKNQQLTQQQLVSSDYLSPIKLA